MSDGVSAKSATLPRPARPRSLRTTVLRQNSQTFASDEPTANSIGAPQFGQLPWAAAMPLSAQPSPKRSARIGGALLVKAGPDRCQRNTEPKAPPTTSDRRLSAARSSSDADATTTAHAGNSQHDQRADDAANQTSRVNAGDLRVAEQAPDEAAEQ